MVALLLSQVQNIANLEKKMLMVMKKQLWTGQRLSFQENNLFRVSAVIWDCIIKITIKNFKDV
jgi:hypothetical protein